ncbi:trigger factor [Pseudobdellovibrio exovorus]|uniref:Trigger factor n=1 Tax=Pseudobdellovibrio exovorus JSS TaxID=1184267 RepID=M4V8R4_9BACT|nr:trigger factor [Pseudobdellovibrio exovorus]AGH94406.1 trigger factor [Pseudobdellovibrio exovorus JSS]
MKAQIQVTEGLQRKLNVEIPAEVVASAFNKVYSDIQRQVEIKGFRKGKAPIATIKTMYKDRVQGDVAQDLISSHYPQALKEQNVDPINYPEFEFEDPAESKDFSFTAIFDIRPEVQLKKWEGLEVEKEKFVLDQKRVDQVLDNVRNSKASFEDVLEQRAAAMGDIAVIDFDGFVDGKALENGAGRDQQLELGSKQFIEGYEEGVVGMKVGETRSINLTFPSPYHSAELAGKPVEFKVTLKGLKKKVVPEITDELLKEIGSNQTKAEFIKTIETDIEQSEKKRIEDGFKNRLLKKLVEANPVDVPASLMKDQKAALIEDFKKRMSDQGMQQAEFESYVAKWDSDFAKTANEMIQSSFLIDKLAADNDLLCKREDIEARFDEYAKQTGIELDRIREWYSKPEQMSRLSYMITEEKVVKFLTDKTKVKEVDAKDLKEDQN